MASLGHNKGHDIVVVIRTQKQLVHPKSVGLSIQEDDVDVDRFVLATLRTLILE